MDLCDHLFELTRITLLEEGTVVSMQVPTWREVRRHFTQNNIRIEVPGEDHPVWPQLYKRISAFIPVAKAHYYRTRNLSTPSSLPVRVAPARTIATDEASIRQMKGTEVFILLEALNLSVPRHPTNAGISVMRGKNALYSFLAKGGRLPGSEEAPSAPRAREARPSVPRGAARWIVTD